MNKLLMSITAYVAITTFISACTLQPTALPATETSHKTVELPTVVPTEMSSPVSTATTPLTAPTESTEDIIFVSPLWVPCVGMAPMLCMQVSPTEEGEWQLFYNAIEGFQFEPGYLYQLKVKQETVQNPPTDASAIKWTLLEEISKSNAELPQLDLTGSSWNLVSLRGNALVDQSQITLSFNEGNMLSGNAGCNTYRGSYSLQGLTFGSGALASTRMACLEPIMTQETSFLQTLSAVRIQELVNNQLLLITPQMEFLLFDLAK